MHDMYVSLFYDSETTKWCFLSSCRESLTSLPVLTGPEDTVSPEKDGPVLRHLGLCQTHLPEGGCGCFLQGLHPQHARHHPLCWHRPGCVRGVHLLTSLFCFIRLLFLFHLTPPPLLSSVRLLRIPGCSATPQTALIRECLCSWLVAPLPAHVASCPATHWPWSGLECRHKVRTLEYGKRAKGLTLLHLQQFCLTSPSIICFPQLPWKKALR